MEREREHEEKELGFVMMIHLSQGELTQIEKIAAKNQIIEKDFLFVMDLAARSTRIPIDPRPPFLEVHIRQNRGKFSIVQVKRNVHLQN